jgi:hypothetical protein
VKATVKAKQAETRASRAGERVQGVWAAATAIDGHRNDDEKKRAREESVVVMCRCADDRESDVFTHGRKRAGWKVDEGARRMADGSVLCWWMHRTHGQGFDGLGKLVYPAEMHRPAIRSPSNKPPDSDPRRITHIQDDPSRPPHCHCPF